MLIGENCCFIVVELMDEVIEWNKHFRKRDSFTGEAYQSEALQNNQEVIKPGQWKDGGGEEACINHDVLFSAFIFNLLYNGGYV